MRSLNVKRLAAVAAGAAMFGMALGTAFGACPDISKDWVYSANGTPNVQIVVGSDAQISDGIAAANLAAVIGSKAYATAGTKTINPTAKGEVKMNVKGSAGVPSQGTWNDYTLSGSPVDSGPISLTLGDAQGMYSGTMNWNGSDYDYKEKVGVNGVHLKYGEDKDYHGVYFTSTSGKDTLYYELSFIQPTFKNVDGKLSNAPEVKFLGKSYVINEVHSNEVIMIQGQKTNLGIGQSTTMTIGNTTYTVTLKSASVDETTNTGYATVDVSDGSNTYTLNLQTKGTPQDGTADGLYVYLQSVQKSYTPGVGGSATLRLGGGKLDLKDGQSFPGYDNWKVSVSYDSTNKELKGIKVYFNKNYNLDDKVSEIVGPEGYFTLKYDGTNMDRGAVEVDKAVFTGDQDHSNNNYYNFIKEVAFSDKNEKNYDFEVYDTSDYRPIIFGAQATNDGNGLSGYVGAYNATGDNKTAVYPLRAGDIFVVDGVPVQINEVDYEDTAAKSYIAVNVPGESATTKYYLSTANTPNANFEFMGLVNSTKKYCGAVDIDTNMGSHTVYVCVANSDNVNFADNLGNETTAWVYGGASAKLMSDYYNITWTNPAWDNTHKYYTQVPDFKMNLTGTGGITYPVEYTNSSDDSYKGIKVGTLVNQATSDASDQNNMYDMTAGALISADGSTVTFKVPEKAIDVRAVLLPGTTTGGVTESAYTISTDDTFPYDVTSGVTVESLTCSADPVTIETGITPADVPSNLVISDSDAPTAEHVIVLGSYYVNKLAKGHTEDLTASGMSDCKFSDDNKVLYVAGYTAQDTLNAVNDLITKIKAL